MTRVIHSRYEDPLDAIWLAAAKEMGLEVVRSPDAYASTDGRGVLVLSDAAGMDPDDCLAQMILHEICHSMIQGPQSFGWVDWGLDNEGTIDDEREHACLRLQAALLEPWGLRRFFGPTTDFRKYYDELPADPFEERNEGERESIVRARAALHRRNRRPWRGTLEKALEATADVLEATAKAVSSPSQASLLRTLSPRPAHTPVGLPLYPGSTEEKRPSCDHCAWAYVDNNAESTRRCRQVEGSLLEPGQVACERYEPVFDCLGCGACCREAYDTVEVADDDPAKKLHLDLLVERTGGFDMGRDGARCRCLRGGKRLPPLKPAISGGSESDDAGERVPPLCMPGGDSFTCDIYETRPQTCRDFTIFSENCLEARRLVGLSR